MKRLVLAAVSMGFLSISAIAQNSNRLPFPNGTYVADAALCRMTAEQIISRYGDQTATLVRNIEGSKFDTGYETFCNIRNVVQAGSTVRFKLICEAEGEKQVSNGSWIKIDERSFKLGNRTFTSCGRLIR